MAEVVVKITIPELEYKEWSDFEKGGIDLVKGELKINFSHACKDLFIQFAKIEVTED